MQDIIDYIRNNQSNYVEELKEFLKIPSISTTPENKIDIERAAEFVKEKLKIAGMSHVEIFKRKGIR